MNVPQSDDYELMRRISRQDEAALSALYERYGGAVYSLALRVTQLVELAEEVTQDTMLKIWNHPERWDPHKGRLLVWLLTVTRHAAIDRLRGEKRQPDLAGTPVEDMENILGTRALVDDPDWQNGRLLRRLMGDLPAEQSTVIELAFFQGYSHTDIAEKLRLPLGTVKTRVRLGLQKLRTLWETATVDPTTHNTNPI
jgi:RNA polymerase sigma-70 factor (ECF subfamily)